MVVLGLTSSPTHGKLIPISSLLWKVHAPVLLKGVDTLSISVHFLFHFRHKIVVLHKLHFLIMINVEYVYKCSLIMINTLSYQVYLRFTKNILTFHFKNENNIHTLKEKKAI